MTTKTIEKTSVPGSRWSSLWVFVAERVPTRVYGSYAVAWVLGVHGVIALAGPPGGGLRLGWGLVAEIATVYLALVFARIVDDQKDLAYDRQFNPDRPVPRGAVRVRDLRIAMAVIAVAEVLLSAVRSPWLVVLVVAFLAYDLFLVLLERWSAALRDSMFRNLAVTYPVQVIMTVHIGINASAGGAGPGGWALVLAVVFAASLFLHYEFGRKTARSVQPGKTLYSNVIGPRGSVFLTLLMPGVALAVAAIVVRPWSVHGFAALAAWLPFAAAGYVWLAADRFFGARAPSWPAIPAMGLLAWTHAGVFAAAVAILPAAR